MNEKMERFLYSIHLEELEKFDLDFDYIMRDRFDNKKWQMQIIKDTPWDYDIFRIFFDALANITYDYNMRFCYRQTPTASDALELFYPWYQYTYRYPSPYKAETGGEDNNKLIFYFTDETAMKLSKEVIKEFKNLLDFLCRF